MPTPNDKAPGAPAPDLGVAARAVTLPALAALAAIRRDLRCSGTIRQAATDSIISWLSLIRSSRQREGR
jgi:hypothetical protein